MNQKIVYLILIIITLISFITLNQIQQSFTASIQTYKINEPLILNSVEENYYLENINLVGNGTGTAITIIGCSRIILRNITLSGWACGINVSNSMFCSYYDLNIQNCSIGVHINERYGINRFYGGSITNNVIGVIISNNSAMNQFYGTEIECNKQVEVMFGSDVYGNIFEGCYFERTPNTSPNFFVWDNINIGTNTFIANKFAGQIDSELILKGNGNTFSSNLFHGGINISLKIFDYGNIIRDNKGVNSDVTVILEDTGQETIIDGNFNINIK